MQVQRMNTKYPTLTVRLPQYTIDWVEDECTQYDMTKGEIVREALNLYYQTKYQSNGLD
jgi:hypothetical protein